MSYPEHEKLKSISNAGIIMVIDKFSGYYNFLSNFSFSPMVIGGHTWDTVEHFYQASKTLDESEREHIRDLPTASLAKKAGRLVKLRSDWENIKTVVMMDALRAKFDQNHELARRLLLTKDKTLIEGNRWHDNEWGDCGCSKCFRIKGRNMLGSLLMQVRDELREKT